jgi:hypothetical protein
MRKLFLISALLCACGSQETINQSEVRSQLRGAVVDSHTASTPRSLSPLDSAPVFTPTPADTNFLPTLPDDAAVPAVSASAPASSASTDAVAPTAPVNTTPVQIPFGELPDSIAVSAPYAPPGAFAEGTYEVRERFLTDQDTFSQWQAMNLSSDGTSLFIAAVDQQTPSKGTVLKMSLTGESWTDLGNSLLSRFTFGATGYTMKKSIRGLAVAQNGKVLISDQTEGVFALDPDSKKMTAYALPLSNASDVAALGDRYFVVTDAGIQMTQAPFAQATPFGTLSGVKALAQHPDGVLYVLSSDGIFRLSESGVATRVLSAASVSSIGWETAKDLAVDPEGNFFVLSDLGVFWFDAKGQLKSELASGDLIDPRALLWAGGSLYIADAGTNHKDSAILQLQ